jgi:hypothetical protein
MINLNEMRKVSLELSGDFGIALFDFGDVSMNSM